MNYKRCSGLFFVVSAATVDSRAHCHSTLTLPLWRHSRLTWRIANASAFQNSRFFCLARRCYTRCIYKHTYTHMYMWHTIQLPAGKTSQAKTSSQEMFSFCISILKLLVQSIGVLAELRGVIRGLPSCRRIRKRLRVTNCNESMLTVFTLSVCELSRKEK